MESIFSFIKSTILWIFILGFCTGAYIGGQFTSYFDYTSSVTNIKILKTPEYKMRYDSNIFYKIDRWLNPENFKDISKIENLEKIKELKKEISNTK